MKIIIFALIPLILSLGIIPALSFAETIDYPRQQMADGIAAEDVVCKSGLVLMIRTLGDAVCVTPISAEKLINVGFGNIQKEASMIEESSLETFETRVGTLELQSDYLTSETQKLLKDELFFQRAIQVYQLALPAVGGAGIFYEQDKVGATTGDILYWSDFMNSDIDLLTGNTSVLYFFTFQDLSNGPIVVNVPSGNLQGHVDNVYQQPITDFGIVGPNEGNEASFLILPPNYDGEIPSDFDGGTENYFVKQSDTMQVLAIGRAFVNAPDKAAAELITSLNVYNLSEIDNPPKAKFIDVSGESLKLSHPTTEGFWEFLHEVYSKETVVRDEDKNLIGLMHSIGIVPGEPFEPDEHTKVLLDEAAIVANLMSRNIAYDSPVKEPFIYYPDKNWELGLMTKNPSFEDERGATMIEPRLSYVYQAITTADAMVLELVGKGSKYLLNYRDSDENFLVGSNTYHLNIPENIPAENFWSIVVYDAETRSMIKNDVQPLPGICSLVVDTLIQNDDGSYDVYFGQEAPEGYENHLINTNEGDGFFLMFRFYSPTAEYYEKDWQLPMVEKLE